jgi:geranylgeranyl pyrophosphate synthase
MTETSANKANGSGGSSPQDLSQRLQAFAAEFDSHFQEYLSAQQDVPPRLLEAVRYSALAPGKRIRPYLVRRCCELVGGSADDAWPAAAAIECVHAFSLVHDDLPAMDDDDLRRGRPTSHKKFGEAVAILAGDALVVLAFELLARHVRDSNLSATLSLELAQGAGWSGMIGGQTADIEGQSKPPGLELAKYIHERKTARLFESACRMGAMVGRTRVDAVDSLGQFGRMLGQAFQIADDLLDLTSSAEAMGKDVGKDAEASKQTYPQCMGIDASRRAAREATNAAIAELEAFGTAADDLRALSRWLADRNY